MPRDNRIVKNYYLKGRNGRGSLWTLWLSPVVTGFNDIYFAGSGYRRANSEAYGFVFHLSHHKDGRSHIKYENDKLYQFQLADQNNFPICSVYAHSDDLLVPGNIPDGMAGDIAAIDILQQSNPASLKWCELFFVHFEKQKAQIFLKKYIANDYDFNIIDQIDIGQNKVVLVLFRFIEATSALGAMPDLNRTVVCDRSNRLTVWGLRQNDERYVAIHDLAATNHERIKCLFRKTSLRGLLNISVSHLAFLDWKSYEL